MKLLTTRLFSLILTAIVFASNAQAQAPSTSELVGMYTQGSVDSQAQMFLLDDNTFCFTFMGGSLDMLKAGRWQAIQPDGTIHLQEVRPDTPIYPAIAKNLDRLGPTKVGINFDGYTLSNARSPVFAVTSTDTQPTTLRPLFSEESTSWEMTYALPLLPPEDAKYFFIGDIEVDKYGKPQRLRVTQYKIGSYDTVRIGFDQIQSDPPLNAKAQLINNVLHLGNDKFGLKRPLKPDMVAEVRKRCINPALYPEKVTASQEKIPQSSEILTPMKSFYLDATAIAGKPFFELKDKNTAAATDSVEDLIESEKMQLQAAFTSAFSDIKTVDKFLNLAKNLAEKKQRIRQHGPIMVEHFAKLLVKINVKGNLAEAEKVFFHFMENIYPAVVAVKDRDTLYNMSVIASQGLIITTAVKNSAMTKLIFEKLLGDKFDIITHKNRTLIYNLACFHAVNNNKPAMLDAIKQARKRGTPPKQFMADADFKNYRGDADFLNMVK